jgi:hypothetical protein
MTTTPVTIQPCPFCAHFGEKAQPISGDFYGTPAMIGTVPSCGECADIADDCKTTCAMLDWLAQQQPAQEAK